MRPLVLTLTAFGPFPQSERIDFRRFGEHPLFLIEGATGAGKTSILDAICFALYGVTTGGEREAQQMRCDKAEPDCLTEIELVFALRGERYRVRRVPRQQRPRSRGDGFTEHAPEAQLWQQMENGEERVLVAKKVVEATDMIRELTGLEAEQFRQVMVLPQGQFRQLLLAESKDREKIFGKLFQTQIYVRLEEKLKEQARQLERDRAEGARQQHAHLTAVEVESIEHLKQQIEIRKQTLDEQYKQLQILHEVQEKSTHAHQHALHVAKGFELLREAEKARLALEQKKPQFEELAAGIKRARAALVLQPPLQAWKKAQSQFEVANRGLQVAEVAVQRAASHLQEQESVWQVAQEKQPAVDVEKKELQELKGYEQRIHPLQRARQALQLAQQGQEKSAKQSLQLQQNVSALAQQLEQLGAQQQQSEQAVLQLQTLDASLQLARQAEERQRALERAEEQSRRTQKTVLDCAERQRVRNAELLRAKLAREQITQAWSASQGAVLASGLKRGKPCPVCGSSEHPSPAHAQLDLEGDLDQQLEQAQQAEERAQVSMSEAQSAHAAAVAAADSATITLEQLQAAAKAMAGDVPSEGVELLQQRRVPLQQLAQRQPELSAQLLEKQVEIKAAEAQQLQTRDALTQCERDFAAATAQVQQAEQELPEAWRDPQVLLDKIADVSQRISRADQQFEQARITLAKAREAVAGCDSEHGAALRQQQDCETQVQQAYSDWLHALTASAFESLEQLQASAQGEAEVLNREQQLEQFNQQVAHASATERERKEQLQDQSPPDLQQTQQLAQQALEKYKQCHEEYQQGVAQRKLLKVSADAWDTIAKKQEELDKRYAVVGTLSHVANGQNEKNLSLHRYVLSVLLDDVLIQAGHRLQLMSRGRYQLQRSSELAHAGRKSGLDLNVEDAHTGQQRPVATLSGGESFIAALSLALGLSDVVQSYAGGVLLDAPFIDEGFGSLDAESLDLAVRALIDLQSTGRMIGIISHVSELREQIDQRLQVIAGRDGSSTRILAQETT